MRTQFMFTEDKGEIKFWTNNDELLIDVCKYIENCIDATRYRNGVEQIDAVLRAESEE